MLDINIRTIKHSKQRYDTVGDWQFRFDNRLDINVSEMQNWRFEILVAVHELLEAMLCKDKNISGKDVDAFDIEYEKNRKPEDISSEPGDDINAPYHKQHQFATIIEKAIANELGVSWQKYEEVVSSL